MLRVLIRGSLEGQISGTGEPFALLAVLLESNHSDKDLILHQVPVVRLLESNEELECAELSAPGVVALGTNEIETAGLGSLKD